jgi:hypothetical protein
MSKQSKKLDKYRKEYKKWSMYKRPKKDCYACHGNGYFLEECCGDSYNTWYNKFRCSCSERPKKRYLKFLTDRILSKKKCGKKCIKMKLKFFDNNSHCDTQIVDTTRSW